MPKPRSKKNAGDTGTVRERRTTSLAPGETRSAINGKVFDKDGDEKAATRGKSEDDETPS